MVSSWPDLSSKLLFGLSKNESSSEDETVGDIIKRFYLGKSPVLESDQAKRDLLDMFTDLSMSLPTAEAAQYHSELTRRSKTFLYELTHRPSLSFSSLWAGGTGFEGEDFGVSFADELFYLFHGLNRVQALRTDEDKATSGVITKLWTDFAKYGEPNPFR